MGIVTQMSVVLAPMLVLPTILGVPRLPEVHSDLSVASRYVRILRSNHSNIAGTDTFICSSHLVCSGPFHARPVSSPSSLLITSSERYLKECNHPSATKLTCFIRLALRIHPKIHLRSALTSQVPRPLFWTCYRISAFGVSLSLDFFSHSPLLCTRKTSASRSASTQRKLRIWGSRFVRP